MSKKLGIEILNTYPLATEAVRDWFLKKMLKSLEEDNVPQDFKDKMAERGVPDQTLAIMLDQSPRNFFDVLDENGIIVEILRAKGDSNMFYYMINGKSEISDMDPLKLKTFEANNLFYEIKGINNENAKIKGLLNQKLPLSAKYDLNKILSIIKVDLERFEEMRNELLHDLGVVGEDGKISLPFKIKNENGDEIDNPNVKKYLESINELETHLVEYNNFPKLNVDLFFGLDVEENYEVFIMVLNQMLENEK